VIIYIRVVDGSFTLRASDQDILPRCGTSCFEIGVILAAAGPTAG